MLPLNHLGFLHLQTAQEGGGAVVGARQGTLLQSVWVYKARTQGVRVADTNSSLV